MIKWQVRACIQVNGCGLALCCGLILFRFFVYAVYQDVHTMMFIGFGFLMTFLRRYGYSSVGFNFLICVYVTEWSLLIRGWFEEGMENHGMFEISVEK
jgi:hypothetical protein